jgi:peptidyl-prolyl cis-trans isomerase C
MKKLLLTTAISMLIAMPVYANEAVKEPAKTAEAPKPTETAKPDYVIMKVGDISVKKSEVDNVWKSIFPGGNPPAFDGFDEKIKENVLRGIASEYVISKEADKAGVKESAEVKERIANAQKQIIIQEFLKIKTKELVTDEKVKAIYDEKVKNAGEEANAKHILVKTEAEAKDLAAKIKKGSKFEDLAKEKSEDKSNSPNGGDLGWFTADKMVPEFSKAAFALKKGEVSAPVKSDFGWHLIKLEDRRKEVIAPFEQLKEQLKQEAGSKTVSEYVNGLMKEVKISVMDEKGVAKEISSTAPAPTAPAAK